jgi:hypothetical protein
MSKGGYRQGSGRSKSGYYKGIYCGSTYELCWVIYSIDTNVKFKRFEKKLTDGRTTYFPDFILDDNKTIIELKGYELGDSVKNKTLLAEKLGYKVIILRKEDLADVFEYVYQKFGTKKFHTLYDGYKPKYEYNCKNCNGLILKDKKKKTNLIYCSRQCSMLGNKLNSDKFLTEEQKKQYYRNQSKKYYDLKREEINKRRRELYKISKGPLV